jgi:esterase/lipase/GNAT superfamily N-acetyltransferase
MRSRVILRGDARVRAHDAAQTRNPDTGILAGAEPLDLGPRSAPGVVLFVHGFSGCPNNFHVLPERVAQAGWRAKALLLPGHGTSPLDFEQTSVETLIEAVRGEALRLRREHRRLVILGHSMGGALATLAAAAVHPDGLILAAPYYAVTYRWYYLLPAERWAELLGPRVRWVYGAPDQQPVKRREISTQIISYSWISTRAARTAIEIARRASDPRLLAQVTCPTLLMHSQTDSVTSPEAAARVLGLLAAAERRAAWYQNSDHILFWDYEREEVTRETLAFLARFNELPTLEIRTLSSELVRPIRHVVLRGGLPFESTIWNGDDDPDTVHFGAYVDGTITGVATLLRKPPAAAGPCTAWQLRGMAVLPEWQRKGVGSKLLEAARNHLEAQCGTLLWCNARASARGFYERAGFTVQGDSFDIPGIGAHYRMHWPG